jgi:hypothetical protein
LYGRQAIEKLHVDLFKDLHFSNQLIRTDPNSPRFIGTADNIRQMENGVRHFKARLAVLYNARATGQRLILFRAMIGRF